ncbi:MAG TPA: 4'-phosphopantetheinyl transferase superfamily protein [Micromonosporaceae bacterium]
MIGDILPEQVAAVEARNDPPFVELFPAEREVIARAVEKRRREFETVRHCARVALARLGVPAAPILPGERGAPQWPTGIVGSMTHCSGYRAAAVARAEHMITVGVDAEPDEPLPDGVLEMVTLPSERGWLAELSASHPVARWDRLLFSAKESVYKAWFPLARRWLGFEDAELTVDPDAGTFTAKLLVPGPVVDGRPVDGFAGRWLVRDGLIVTAIAVPVDRP